VFPALVLGVDTSGSLRSKKVVFLAPAKISLGFAGAIDLHRQPAHFRFEGVVAGDCVLKEKRLGSRPRPQLGREPVSYRSLVK
jgi:hypothetical protein